MCSGFYRYGIKNFMLSHISQKNIIPHSPKIRIYTNENVYTLNDAAIQFLKEEYVTGYVYPLENDFPNLISGKDRKGIVPLFFYPELFFSRMPVSFHHEDTKAEILEDRISHCKDTKTQREENDKMHSFADRDFEYRKIVKDGMTITVPEKPVSLLHYKDKIYQKGFRHFLLDFSHSKVSKNIFNRILKKYRTSTAEQPSLNFNFKMGLS